MPQCTANSRFCAAGVARLCADDGLSSEAEDVCEASEYCDVDSATCIEGVCAPNQPTCTNGLPAVCNDDGSAFVVSGSECLPGQTCDAGVCRDHVCTPEANFCQGNEVATCTADGLAASVTEVCEPSEFCDEDLAACSPDLCISGASGCGNDEQPQRCNDDGDGWEDDGAACSGNTPVCLGGDCVTCSPDQRDCVAQTPRVCSAEGSWVAQAACDDPKPVCDAPTGTCQYEDSREVAGVVACGANGETVCDVTAGEYCCVTGAGANGSAPPAVNACVSAPDCDHGLSGGYGSTSHRCDADDDCPTGDVCCFHQESDGLYTACMSDCNSYPNSAVCIPGETQCPNGGACTPQLTPEFGIGSCPRSPL